MQRKKGTRGGNKKGMNWTKKNGDHGGFSRVKLGDVVEKIKRLMIYKKEK
jgi:hypothetical protein